MNENTPLYECINCKKIVRAKDLILDKGIKLELGIFSKMEIAVKCPYCGTRNYWEKEKDDV
jgi:DNA-directed RNA polymerase subunit RPC12/RpoP